MVNTLLCHLEVHIIRECVYTWPVLCITIYEIDISHLRTTCSLGRNIACKVKWFLYSHFWYYACFINTKWLHRDRWIGESCWCNTNFLIRVLANTHFHTTSVKTQPRTASITFITFIMRFSIKEVSQECNRRCIAGQAVDLYRDVTKSCTPTVWDFKYSVKWLSVKHGNDCDEQLCLFIPDLR